MQSDYLERRVKLNRNTSVVIKSKKAKDADIFRNTLTIVHETADIKPLQFASRSELEAAIKEFDIEEDQTMLFGGEDK